MAKAVLKRAKKTRKNVTEWIVHIFAHFNNTHVTVSDLEWKVLCWATWWSSWFKWAREATPYAAQITSENVCNKAKNMHGLEKVKLFIKWIWVWREQAIRWVSNTWIEILSIFDVTPVPHNGCRKQKVRKL